MKTLAIDTNDVRMQKGCMTLSTPAFNVKTGNPTTNDPALFAGLINKLIAADSSPKTEQTKNLSIVGPGGTNTNLPNVVSATTEWNTWNIYPEEWMKFDDTPPPAGMEYRYNPQTNERKAVKSCGETLGTEGCVLPQSLGGTNTDRPNVASAALNRPILEPGMKNENLLERFEQRLNYVGIGFSPNFLDFTG